MGISQLCSGAGHLVNGSRSLRGKRMLKGDSLALSMADGRGTDQAGGSVCDVQRDCCRQMLSMYTIQITKYMQLQELTTA